VTVSVHDTIFRQKGKHSVASISSTDLPRDAACCSISLDTLPGFLRKPLETGVQEPSRSKLRKRITDQSTLFSSRSFGCLHISFFLVCDVHLSFSADCSPVSCSSPEMIGRLADRSNAGAIDLRSAHALRSVFRWSTMILHVLN
jgi:hypothetical protein